MHAQIHCPPPHPLASMSCDKCSVFRSHASTHNNRQNCKPEGYSEHFRFRGSLPSKGEGYCRSTASTEQPVLIPYPCWWHKFRNQNGGHRGLILQCCRPHHSSQQNHLLSSNKSFVESDWYTYLLTFQVLISANLWFITLLMCFVPRNASRMVHIPFFQPDSEVCEADKRDAEENLRVVRTTALSSLAQLIALGENFSAVLIQECMELNA